jgi:hypothetical protein
MEPRWNKVRPDATPKGNKAKPNASISGPGLEVKQALSTSGRGIRMFLTSPLIDQAIALTIGTAAANERLGARIPVCAT